MSGAPAVTSAQTTIERVWPEHGAHKSGTRHARWSTAEGVVCACGDVLGWPDPEHHETYSQYTKRIAAEQVDAASAPGRVQGAFGSYARPTPEPEDSEPATVLPGGDNAPEPGDYPDPEVQEPPEDGEPAYDPWQDDTPEDEPEPDHVDPAIAQARRATGVMGVTDVALPADEAQAGPPYAVGDTVTVGGVEFVKHSESPFPEHNPSNEGIPAGSGWNDGERTEEAEIADGSQAEYSGGEVAVREEPGVGQEVVPFRGMPIFPGEGQELDPLVDRLDPLDPTLPYTPADVELKIVDIMRAIDRSELFLRQQIAREHAATHNLDFRYNLAIAQSDAKAADQRKAEAWIATERERFEATEASMLVRALRDSQHNLRSVLSGYQSVARSLGVSMTNALDGRLSGPARPPIPTEPPPDPWTH